MTGVFSKQLFGFANESTIEELNIFSKNLNTVKSTSFLLNVIEENEPEKLNMLLGTLYAELKNKSGDDYEPDSLRVMIAAPDRHLNEKGYKFFIIRDREFHSSKQVLEGKSSMGKRLNKARLRKKKRCCGRQKNLVPKLQKRLFLLCGGF